MSLEKKPFRLYNDTEDKDNKRTVLPVSLNKKELQALQRDKEILNQPKDSTALKQLAEIGSIVIHDQKICQIIDTVFKNKKKNKRTGIIDYEQM